MMFRRLSFQVKIGLLVALPSVSVLTLVALQLQDELTRFRQATTAELNLTFLESVSALVHQTQRERGATVLVMKGQASVSDLDEQRRAVDQRLAEVKRLLPTTSLVEKDAAALARAAEAYASLRSEVSTTSSPSAIAKRYGNIVDTWNKAYGTIAETTKITSVRPRMRTVAAFEAAKEFAGRLRVLGTDILSRNEPLTAAEIASIIDFKGTVQSSLESPSLVISASVQTLASEFKSSDDWKRLTQILLKVLEKSQVGQFGEDPKLFFAAATKSIDQVYAIVQKQLNDTREIVLKEQSEAERTLIANVLASILFCAILIVLCALFTRSMARTLERIVRQLAAGSGEVNGASAQVSRVSQELSEAVTEQAAATQETVSALDEIQAMVERNREASTRSQATSRTSAEASREGKDAVDRVIRAITEISDANLEIAQSTERSNQQIEEIVRVISEIGNKTRVINDIVFQTKLLSFNASVEAARAGEHGKGFAVVAEEVGNLAQMSGTAAQEITTMLDEGINKVKDIVVQSRERVERAVGVSRTRVETGTVVATECGAALDKILNNVTAVDGLVSEIATASEQQAQGIQEVTKAMNQMDSVMQKNSEVAGQAAESGTQLAEQARTLDQVVCELRELISGAGAMAEHQSNITFAPAAPVPRRTARAA